MPRLQRTLVSTLGKTHQTPLECPQIRIRLKCNEQKCITLPIISPQKYEEANTAVHEASLSMFLIGCGRSSCFPERPDTLSEAHAPPLGELSCY